MAVIDQTPGKADPKRQLGTGEKVEGGLQAPVKKDDAKKIEATPEKGKDKATNVADNAEKAKSAPKAVPNELGADSKSRWAKIKQLALKCVDKEFEDTEAILKNTDCVALIKSLASLTSTDLEYAMTKNVGKKIEIDDVEMPMDNAIEALVQKKDIEKLVSGVKVSGVRIKDSSKQIASNTKYTKDQKREILLKRLNRYKNKLAKKSNDEFSKTKIKELDVYLNQIGEGFTYPTGYERVYEEASGTASSVLDCWNNFVRDAEIKKDFLQITQREHDRLNGLLNGIDSEKTVLEYNLSENPDPIIAITRIFKRAHDLYYHDVIPSGRSNGAVSNKTFREYEKLGGGASSQTTQDNPGVGPWAVKSIRNKWTDGVMEILEDQNYRKILANIRFVVPGSEDTFNRATEQAIMKWNNFIKIFEEADVEDDKVKKSQGQILFDFINDMLSDEAAASFDKQRRILMKKYFGFKDEAIKSVEKKDENIPAPPKPPKTGDTVPKSMSWADTKAFESFGTSKYEGPFYAIPIEKKNDHRMLFLHLLKNIELKDKSGNVSNGYLIKYTFDQPAIMEKFIAEKHPGYKIETDWATGTAKVSYYGIVKAFPKGNFKVAYLNTSSKNISTDEFTLFNESAMDINAKKVTVYPAHLMITDDKNNTSMIKTDFSAEVFSEKSNHAMLTDDLLDKLKEEAVK